MRVHATVKLLCWHLLHLVFSFIAFCVSVLSHVKSSLSFASSHKIKKLPRHLALLVDSEDVVVHLSKLVMLLEQLAHLGLQHISLYDVKGTLKCVLADVLKNNSTVQFYSHDFASDESLKQDLECTHKEPCFKQKIASGKHVTGSVCCCEKKGQLVLEVLCLRDGKQAIVEAARNICLKSLQSGAFSDIREEDIDASLKETGTFGPDPDVLLLFSNLRCLQGFPPWRLRLTEIQALVEDLPAEWTMHTIAPIHKVGDMMDPNNYRMIMIRHALDKLYGAVMEAELSTYAEREGLRARGQVGCRAFSTINDIFTLRCLID